MSIQESPVGAPEGPRTIALDPNVVRELHAWSGGQGSAVYRLASRGQGHLVSVDMIDEALAELRRDVMRESRRADRQPALVEGLLTLIDDLEIAIVTSEEDRPEPYQTEGYHRNDNPIDGERLRAGAGRAWASVKEKAGAHARRGAAWAGARAKLAGEDVGHALRKLKDEHVVKVGGQTCVCGTKRADNPVGARFTVWSTRPSSGQWKGGTTWDTLGSFDTFEEARRFAQSQAWAARDRVITDAHLDDPQNDVVWRSAGAKGHHRLDNPACGCGGSCEACARQAADEAADECEYCSASGADVELREQPVSGVRICEDCQLKSGRHRRERLDNPAGKMFRFDEGVMTQKEWVERFADRVEAAKVSMYRYIDRTRWNRMDGREQAEYERKAQKRAEKPEYRAYRSGDDSVYQVISKATYDWAVERGMPIGGDRRERFDNPAGEIWLHQTTSDSRSHGEPVGVDFFDDERPGFTTIYVRHGDGSLFPARDVDMSKKRHAKSVLAAWAERGGLIDHRRGRLDNPACGCGGSCEACARRDNPVREGRYTVENANGDVVAGPFYSKAQAQEEMDEREQMHGAYYRVVEKHRGAPYSDEAGRRVGRYDNPARATVDDAHERGEMLAIAVTSEGTLYPLRKQIEENLAKKIASGKYQRERAPQAFSFYVEEGARLLAKENQQSGEDKRVWHDQYPAAVRRVAAEEIAESVEAELRLGRSERDGDEEVRQLRSPAEGGPSRGAPPAAGRRDNPVYPALGPAPERRDNPVGSAGSSGESVPLKLMQPKIGERMDNPAWLDKAKEHGRAFLDKVRGGGGGAPRVDARVHKVHDAPVEPIAYSHARAQGCALPPRRKHNPTGDTAVADTILEQLGGMRRLSIMIGAKHFVALENGVQFSVGSGAKGGINKIRVVLRPSDTYDVEFWKIRGTSMKKVSEWEDVYNDQLKGLVEKETGFYLRLDNPAVAGAAQ